MSYANQAARFTAGSFRKRTGATSSLPAGFFSEAQPICMEDIMQSIRSSTIRIFCLCAIALSIGIPAGAQEFRAGTLVIDRPWTRATPGGAKVAGGFMTITNTGTEPDRLIGGSLPRAGRFEVHETRMEGDVMRMRPLPKGLEIGPGQTATLAPGGYHVMFMDLKEPLKQGERLRGQLVFERAGTIEVEYAVESLGAQGGMQGKKAH